MFTLSRLAFRGPTILWTTIRYVTLHSRDRSNATTISVHEQKPFRHPMRGNPGQSWILDSTLWIQDSRYWIPVFFNGTWILDSNRWWYSGFLELYSEYTRKNFPDYRIRILLHGAIWSSNCSLQVKLWNPFTPCMTKMQVTGAGIYSVYITKQHRSASGRLIIIPHSNTSAKVLFLVSIIQ